MINRKNFSRSSTINSASSTEVSSYEEDNFSNANEIQWKNYNIQNIAPYIGEKDLISKLEAFQGKGRTNEKTGKKRKTKNSKDSTITFEALVLFIHSQNGTRYFQNKVTENPSLANSIIYPILKPAILQLINARYGSHLYCTFIDILTKENLEDLIFVISKNFDRIAYNQRGKKVIQKLLEIGSKENPLKGMIYETIRRKIQGRVSEMAKNEVPNTIIVSFISSIKYPFNNFVYEEIYISFLEISNSKYGSCVIQKCLINGNEKQKEKITSLIVKNTFNIIKNQYGNYVYQCLIENSDDDFFNKIFNILSKEFISLCLDEYSYKVILKIFDIKNERIVNRFANHILRKEGSVLNFICNICGCKVIDKILSSITDESLIQSVVSEIKQNVTMINKYPFIKGILSNWLN